MFLKSKHKSMFGRHVEMPMDMDVLSVVKVVAASAIIYQTAKFMLNEMTHD